MKWPASLMLIRHDTSAYNVLRGKKEKDSVYQTFLKEFEKNPESEDTVRLAKEIEARFALDTGDWDTPLADLEGKQALKTGRGLREQYPLPDVIFVSPYHRTIMTLECMKMGWPELEDVKTYEEERIREQEHGEALLYNDWRIFHALNPKQRRLYEKQGPYWYCYPQGENVPNVRERVRSWFRTLTKDFRNKRVLAITHNITILSIRANLERLGANEFIHLDQHEKPINCGVTGYRGDPLLGKNGKLILDFYNNRYY